ncbi:MAG: T9SS type A sorting domain-containing protein, partial [Saprospiraceae bacterium]
LFSKNFQFKNKVNTYGVQSKFALPYNINPGNYHIIADMAGNSKKGNITFKPYVIPISIGVNGQFVTTQSRSKYVNNENIHISPNPFSDLLFVQDGTARDKKIEILDIFGKTVRIVNLQANENRLSLDDLPSALYVIKVTGAEGLLYSGKFCKI